MMATEVHFDLTYVCSLQHSVLPTAQSAVHSRHALRARAFVCEAPSSRSACCRKDDVRSSQLRTGKLVAEMSCVRIFARHQPMRFLRRLPESDELLNTDVSAFHPFFRILCRNHQRISRILCAGKVSLIALLYEVYTVRQQIRARLTT